MKVFLTCMGGDANAELRVCDFDLTAGRLSTLHQNHEGISSPLYGDLDPSGRFMVVADYVPDCDGTPGGAICAFALQPDGSLQYLNRKPCGGATPCYAAVSRDGRFVLAANYGDGSVSVLPISDDGTLSEPIATIKHEGSSVTERQKGPHAHCFRFDPGHRFALAADLGMDQVVVYRFDADRGTLTANDPAHVKSRPGAGPRHIAFSRDGSFAYVINELDNTIDTMRYDPAAGTLEPRQTVPALPPGFTGTSWASDIHVHPNGRFLYGSNRGEGAPSSIVMCAIAPDDGTLTVIGHEPSGGDFPRGFGIDPSGQYAIVANQESSTVDTFRIDQQTGRLTATGHVMEAPKPVAVNFGE